MIMGTISKIKSILSNKYLLLISSQLVIVYSALVNRLPLGYVVSGGDTSQIINWPKMVHDASYLWSNSSSEGYFVSNYAYNLYDSVIYFLRSLFGISLENQAILFIFIFLTVSFWSFYLVFKFFDLSESKISEPAKILFSLAYAFNIYTLHYFTGIWGYGPQFLFLYTLIPIIFALTYRYFSDLNRKSALHLLPILGIVFFFSNISNGNLSFFIANNILLFVLIVLIYLYGRDRISLKKYLKYALVYFGLFFVSVSWSVIPQIQEMLRVSSTFATGSALFDLRAWILWQAANIPTVFFFGDLTVAGTNIRFLTFLAGAISFCLMLVLSIQQKFFKQEKIFLLILLVCIFLLNKGKGIFSEDMIWVIFKNPVLGSLRSYDKAAIFMPFLVLISIAFVFPRQIKIIKYSIVSALFVSLLSAYPFLRGNIQTVYSVAHHKNQNYLSTANSSLVKIPNEYKDTANRLNQQKLLDRIVSGPYNVINSVGWVNFPKWKLIGVDPTVQLFDKPVSQMNQYAFFDSWNYGKLWNRQSTAESEWFLPFLGLINGRYFIYHSDVDPKFIEQTSDKIKNYVEKGFISEVEKNDYFTLYKLADQFYLPHLYTPTETQVIDLSVPDLPEVINKEMLDNRQALYFTKGRTLNNLLADMPSKVGSSPTIEYRKISPTKYRALVHQSKDNFPFIFSETYSDSWKIYPMNSTKATGKASTDNYQQFAGNADDQATKEELNSFINNGLVSDIGQNRSFTAFVSKDFKGTIQNDNLAQGSIFETWFKKPLSSEYQHTPVNGYANSWLISPEKFCEENSCIKNADGSWDFEFVIEFWPQRLYYIFGFVMFFSVATCVIFVIKNIFTKKR